MLAKPLRDIIEEEPLEARIEGRSAEAVIHDLLLQAEAKGKSGDVAQYLVGAKLALRFKREIPVHPANKSDRKSRSDKDAKLGDFVIENAVIEVAVGLPDEKHLEQIGEILRTPILRFGFWLEPTAWPLGRMKSCAVTISTASESS